MINYRKINNVGGWLVFAISTIVYLLTIEPTASWWDCGEYIATAYKLQVGHPPGAPLFQMLGRFFTLFAFGDVTKVALMMNVMSALSSSLTVLFLFWTITMLAKKVATASGEFTQTKMFAVLGSGLVGALAYTFSDSFWFSAVEGEVYAMSSFFTALVFWAILKWEADAEDKHNLRWLIFIAYLIGLSIGVHLLNLLAIPAIAYVYYYKKYETTQKGLIYTGVISILILAAIMYVVVPWIVKMSTLFELLFVNDFGLPFNSGTFFYFILLILMIVIGLYFTQRKSGVPIFENVFSFEGRIDRSSFIIALITIAVIEMLLVFLFGSILGVIGVYIVQLPVLWISLAFGVKRCHDIGKSGWYLLIPLFYIWLIFAKGNQSNNKYGAANQVKEFEYSRRRIAFNTIILSFVFVLIGYSSFFMLIIRSNADVPIDENSPEEAISMLSYLNREQYGNWPLIHGAYYNAPLVEQKDGSPIYFKDKKKGKYTIVGHHLESEYDSRFTTFFPRIWSDREERHIDKYQEYITGKPIRVTKEDGSSEVIIKPTFMDNLRYFFSYQVGHMYVRYFMWNFVGRQNDIESQGDPRFGNWISGVGFIDRWIQGDQEVLPDAFKNEGTNTFYFLPLILGLIGAFFHFLRNSKDTWVVFLLFFMTGLAIVIYLNQFPHQPRERDYAFAGSFYAFAIWIGMGVLAISETISKLAGKKGFIPVAVTGLCLILVPGIMASQGWDDHDRSGKYAARDFAKNYLRNLEDNAVIYTVGDNDTFPLWYVQEVEGFRTDTRVVNYMLSSGEWYVLQLGKKAYEAEPLPFTIPPEKYDKGQNQVVPYYPVEIRDASEHIELKSIIDFIESDNRRSQLPLQSGKFLNFLPTKKVKLTVDSAACVDNGIVPKELAHLIVPEITWEIKANNIMKNDLAFLDFLATNNWTRPIYFTNPVVTRNVFDATEYIFLEGTSYRFMPIRATDSDALGGIQVDKTYDILMNETTWGNLNDPDVTVDRESNRNIDIASQNFTRLSRALVNRGELQKAVDIADRYYNLFPMDKIPVDYYAFPFIQVYYHAGANEKANTVSRNVLKRYLQEIRYYATMEEKWGPIFENDFNQAFAVLQQLAQLAEAAGQMEFVKEIDDSIAEEIKKLEE